MTGRAAGHVRVVAGGAAGGGGVAAADVVPVPFDEHHLAGAGEPAGDAVGDLAGDAHGPVFIRPCPVSAVACSTGSSCHG